MGNGQPGHIQQIRDRLEKQSALSNRGIGAVLALQAVMGALIALMAAGVIRLR